MTKVSKPNFVFMALYCFPYRTPVISRTNSADYIVFRYGKAILLLIFLFMRMQVIEID